MQQQHAAFVRVMTQSEKHAGNPYDQAIMRAVILQQISTGKLQSGEETMRKNNYDEIRIENLSFANHGVSGGDQARPEIYDIADDGHGYTSLAGRMSWSHLPPWEVSHFIVDFMAKHTCKLIEAAAEKLAEALLLTHPLWPEWSWELKLWHRSDFVENGICENQTVLGIPAAIAIGPTGRQAHIR